MTRRHTHEECRDDPAPVVLERNNYFNGKYMAARDFRADQTYMISRHRMHNRLLHGWGIVCGLEVDYHPNPECRDRWIQVAAGIAMDCCGRELILPTAMSFELPLPPSEAQAAASNGGGAATEQQARKAPPPEPPETFAPPFLVCLRYCEEPIDQVPVLYSEGACGQPHREPNRIREGAEIVVYRPEDLPGCWPPLGDCPEPGVIPVVACLDPDCTCGQVVPLALIGNPVLGETEEEYAFTIDQRGRRRVPPPPGLLTHIVRTNWQHGREYTLTELRAEVGNRLVVTFDRNLLPPPPEPGDPRMRDATGINQYTFVVQYWGLQKDIEFLTPVNDTPLYREEETLTEEETPTAVFEFPEELLGPRPGEPPRRRGGPTLAENTVFITLKCDFIMDCHNNPVDGNHLRGRLPSGDGSAGGTFESWFYVVAERDESRSQ